MSFAMGNENQPVTVVVSQVVKPGCEQAYEQWIKGIYREAQKFEGHLGITILRPEQKSRPEYAIIFRFDCYANLKTWMESDVRKEWVAKSKQLVQDVPNVQLLTGVEAWFTLPSKPIQSPPPRYKMAILTWVPVYALLNILSYILAPVIRALPLFLAQLIISALMVTLLTYLVMPQITRLFYKWLYPNREK